MRLLKAFVAKSFSSEDKDKNEMIEAILDRFKPLGLIRTTAEPIEIESVSKNVREKIDACDLFICILTRRHQIASALQGSALAWAAAPWLHQESGYALKAGKKLLLLFESGVERPGLQGDLEHIVFDPSESIALTDKLLELLPKLIAQHSGESVVETITAQSSGQTPANEATAEPAAISPAPSSPDESRLAKDFYALLDAWRGHDLDAMKKAHLSGLKFAGMAGERSIINWNCVALQYRAQSGDRDALQDLEEISHNAESGTDRARALAALARVFDYLDDHKSAAKLFVQAAEADPEWQNYALSAAKEYRLAKERDTASAILFALLARGELPQQIKADLFKEMFRIYKGTFPGFCFAEAALMLDPVDHAFRFSVAYAYSEIEAAFGHSYQDLAAYHYQFCADKAKEVGAVNNLGVIYQNLNLPIHAVNQYAMASRDGQALAASNLMHMYLNAGFVKDTEHAAEEFKGMDPEGLIRQALGQIHSNRAAEEARISEIGQHQAVQRQGLARLAETGVLEPQQTIGGTWELRPTQVILTTDSPNRISGEGESPTVGILSGLGKTLFAFTATRLDSPIWQYEMKRKASGTIRRMVRGFSRSPGVLG